MSEERTVEQVAGGLELSEEATKLMEPKALAPTFFDKLINAKLYPDAIRYTSRLLTPQAAIWWGCLCLWHVKRPGDNEKLPNALRATVQWLQDPSEKRRREAEAAAKAAGTTTPEGTLAYAVFLSGGSISVPDQTEVPTKPHYTPKCVANVVLAASRLGPASETMQRQLTFLQLATSVYRDRKSVV